MDQSTELSLSAGHLKKIRIPSTSLVETHVVCILTVLA